MPDTPTKIDKLRRDGPRTTVALNVPGTGIWVPGEALIDTGAGTSVVCPVLGYRLFEGRAADNHAPFHDLICGHRLEASLFRISIQTEGQQYDVEAIKAWTKIGYDLLIVLGRDVLRWAPLAYDGTTGDHDVQFHPPK